jgi:thiol-disulfide isomerase/thioredoxin
MNTENQSLIAPEIFGNHWINSSALSVRELRGSVVLLFFWEYCCIRSLRLLSYIQELNARYRESGLITIGVHTPSYPFAQDVQNVERAVADLNIDFSILLDNDKNVYDAYRLTALPTMVLIDSQGIIRLSIAGRGKQNVIERQIQAALRERGNRGDLPLPIDALRPEEIPGAFCSPESPDILFGYLRKNLGNKEGFNPESVYTYEDPGYYLPGRYYLNGVWQSRKKSMVMSSEDLTESYLILGYDAKEVYAVIGNPGNRPAELEIKQDGDYLTETNRGSDVILNERGVSTMHPGEPRLLNLVQNRDSSEHILKISAVSGDAEFFSLSFIPGVIPELLNPN